MMSRSFRALCWCIRHHQDDLMEAIALHGYRSISQLIETLMEIDQCQ